MDRIAMGLRTSQEVQRAIDEQTSRIESRLDAIRRDIKDLGAPARTAIQRNPVRALAIATGAGVALGVLAAHSLQRRADDESRGASPEVRIASPRRSKFIARLLVPLLMDHGIKFLTRDRA